MVPKIRGIPPNTSKRRASGGGAASADPEIKKLGNRSGKSRTGAVEAAAAAAATAAAAAADARVDFDTENGGVRGGAKRVTRSRQQPKSEAQSPSLNNSRVKLRSSTGQIEAEAEAEAAKAEEVAVARDRTPTPGKKPQRRGRDQDEIPVAAASKKHKAGEATPKRKAVKKSLGGGADAAPASNNEPAGGYAHESPVASDEAAADADADADDNETPITTFAMGDFVEVRYQEKGLYGSWQAGKICGVRPGLRQVEFRTLISGKQKSLLKEWVRFQKETLHGKLPRGAKVSKDGRPILRPAGPGSPPRKPSFRKTGGWPKNLWVEVFYNDAWWEGALSEDISASQMPQRESVITVYYPELNLEEEVALKNIREAKDWDEDTDLWKIRGKRLTPKI